MPGRAAGIRPGVWIAARADAIVAVLATFVAIKVAFYVVAAFALMMLPEYAGGEWEKWYTGAPAVIDLSWRWDGEWYLSIAREGYRIQTGWSNVAFFPLFPLLIRLFGPFLGPDGYALAGVLVVNLAFLGALFYLHALAAMDGGAAHARRAVWYVAIFPSAFFFHAAYSESLFLLSAAGVLWHARQGEWWRAGLWGLLAALTRTQGVLLVLPLAWELGRRWWTRRERVWPGMLALGLPPLGLLSFMAHLHLRVGDALAFMHVQSEWGRSFAFPLVTLLEAVRVAMEGPGEMHYPLGLLNTLAVLLVLGVAIANLGRWPAVYSIYVWASLIVALASPAVGRPTESGARFMAVLFPVMFALAAWSESRPLLARSVTAVSLVLFALLTALFVNWYWVV